MSHNVLKIGSLALGLFLASTSYGASGWTDDLKCLAKTIYHESRGEPYDGQVAVAYVVLNRSKSGKFPDKVCDVVLQPRQFHFSKVKKIYDFEAYGQATTIASRVLSGEYEDPTKGALFFAHHQAVKGRSVYKRYSKMKIGQHLFWAPKT